MLPSGDVERNVVLDKATARVDMRNQSMLKPWNSEETVAHSTTDDSNFDSSTVSNNNSNIDFKQMETQHKTPIGSLTIQHQEPHMSYYINIGSVDSFENKLAESQKQLGIDSKHGIPVTYEVTPDYGGILYRSAMMVRKHFI